MKELEEIKAALVAAVAEIEAYASKPTKAASARIRKVLVSVKNKVTATRNALLSADKA